MVTGNRMLPVYRRCQNFSTNTLLAHGSHNRHGRGWRCTPGGKKASKPNCGRQLRPRRRKNTRWANARIALSSCCIASISFASPSRVSRWTALLGVVPLRTLYRVSSTFVVVRVFYPSKKSSLRAVDQSTGSFERLRETFLAGTANLSPDFVGIASFRRVTQMSQL